MFYFIFDLSSQTGDKNIVAIKLNGKIYDEISLNYDKDVEIYLDDGTHLTTVRIQDKKVFIVYANCPDKLCVKHKPLDSESFINNMIVCLPNRVTVEIISLNKSDKSKEFDVIIGN